MDGPQIDGAPAGEGAGRAPPAFAEALRFWTKLGWINFGGPAGQIAIMHDELVDRRQWVAESTFLHGLNYCMLLPGPEAMQLATWLGWRLHGVRGGVAAGNTNNTPAALLMALLGWVYMRFGHVPLVAGALFGIQAAVLGIIVHALLRIGRRVLKTPFALLLALLAALALGVMHLPFPVVVLGAGFVGVAIARFAPRWLPAPDAGHAVDAAGMSTRASVSHALAIAVVLLALWWLPLLAVRGWLGGDSTAWAMGLFFSKAALVTIGGAYAVLPYVAQQAVEVHGWLGAEQMLVGLGLAESTPGPLIMVLEFAGFVGGWQHPDFASPLASALLCAAVTVWATFLPSFLFVLPLAPWIERLRNWPAATALLTGITAAVVGTIANLAVWFGWQLLSTRALADTTFILAIALAAWLGLARRRWNVAWIVLGAGLAGMLAQVVGLRG